MAHSHNNKYDVQPSQPPQADDIVPAQADRLTGLGDVRRFYELASEALRVSNGEDERIVAVAFDLMGMKGFNTRYGRSEGDKALRVFACVLKEVFGSDACCRLSEDCFYAFAPEAGVEDRVRSVFAGYKTKQGETALPVRCGLYACEPDDEAMEVVFDRAKLACDLDRKTWQSHLTWFTNTMRASERLRIHVLATLDQAITEKWIRPYYQAIVRSATGDVCGEEALARWIDPQYGELRPGQFIPVLEEAGLLQRLDMHMVNCALDDMATKQKSGIAIVPVSVNISLRDLAKLDVASEVRDRADAVGVAHDLLRIEFTESAATDDPSYLRDQVEKLHSAGFEVWMDDFGSGYSSLSNLQRFDFDLIKLDMGFLHADNFEKSKAILEATVRAAGKLGVGTLAEGVETEEQAIFLESIGCDMLQGYYYNDPKSLAKTIASIRAKKERDRERYDEAAYWDAVSLMSLTDINGSDAGESGWVPLNETPMGILERRNGAWRVLRANKTFDKFLKDAKIVSESYSHLHANPLVGELGDGFNAAIRRCVGSGAWEHAAVPLELGTGYQLYVKYIASVPDAEAYLMAAMPAMAGNALELYGDVPVGYAVFRVVLNEAKDAVVDAYYVYTNEQYCKWGNYDQKEIIGKSFLSVHGEASPEWFPYCYRAAVLGENVKDIVYSPEMGHWLRFSLVPSPIEGCCMYALTIADEEHDERQAIIVDRDTSDFIIDVADVLSGPMEYEKAMNRALRMLSEAIHPQRLFVYERGRKTTSCTFEWCAPGVSARKQQLQSINNSAFTNWNRLIDADPSVRALTSFEHPVVGGPSAESHSDKHEDEQMLVVPLYGEGRLLGYLGAENYVATEGLEILRLFKAVASFMSARVMSRRLVSELEKTSMQDSLTGLLNRRGIDTAIGKALQGGKGVPYVLALMDVDDFKTVNDLYGHDVGDEALRSLSTTIQKVFPKGSILGRNGGDEFLAMLVGSNARRAEEYIRKLSDMKLSCTLEGRVYPLSMSIGFVDSSQADTLQHAYSKADAALYAIKLAGKAGMRKYDDGIDASNRSQLGFTPRDIAENIPAALLVHRKGDGDILFANDELVSLLECDTLEDLMEYTGGTYGGVIHPDDRERVEQELGSQMGNLARTGKDYVEFRVLTKKGNVRNVANNGKLVRVEGEGDLFYELMVNLDERANR